jgi:hypothetical protein
MTQMLEEALEKHVTAMVSLQKIPGVVGVGFGLKEKAGQVTSEWAYRVYVKEKRPIDQLDPAERIPKEMGGIRTDVLFGMFSVSELSCTKDLAPGDQVTRFMPGDPSSQGTLGVLVRDGAKKFIMTNQHVLHTENQIASKDVYDPKQKTICEIVCNKPAATVQFKPGTHEKGNIAVGGKTFYVDAALAEINSGIKGANVVEGVGPLDNGTRDLSTVVVNAAGQPTEVITVRKKGATTGLTVGTVTQLFRLEPENPANPSGPQTPVFKLVIKPAIGNGFDYEQEVHVAASQDMALVLNAFPAGGRVQIVKNDPKSDGSRILKVKGQVFDRKGDSGSPVVDSQRKIVGLVYAAAKIDVDAVGQTEKVELLTGDGLAVYIEASLQAIGLTPAAIIPPGIPLAGEAVLAPGSPITVDVDYEGQAIQALEAMRAPLAETRSGQRLLTLVPHMPEIINLVRHRRRVTVVWHRNKGPAFAVAFLRSLSETHRAVPVQIGEIPRSTGLTRLRDVLLQEGSESLKEWLHSHSDWMINLATQCSTIVDLYGALAQDSESTEGGV